MATSEQLDPTQVQFKGMWYWRDSAEYRTVLEAEVERLRRECIVEVASHNQSVAEYCAHWEGRVLKAEAEVERLRAVTNSPQRHRKCLWPAVGHCWCDACKRERKAAETAREKP